MKTLTQTAVSLKKIERTFLLSILQTIVDDSKRSMIDKELAFGLIVKLKATKK